MKRYAVKLLVSAVIAAVVYLPSVVRLQQLTVRDRSLSQQLQHIVQQNHLLAEENEMLQHDPEHIEAVAREKLKVAKKNEIILRVINEPAIAR